MRMEITRASTLDEIIAEMDRRGRCLDRNAEYIERLKAVHRDAESEITRLRAANAELVAALKEIAELPGELNPSNYTHDDVCACNNAFIETWVIARAALTKAKESGE